MKNVFFYDMPIGGVGIAEDGGAISRVYFPRERALHGFETHETPLIKKAFSQLKEYFFDGRREFDLPLALKGTEFQISVWEALSRIPYGETRSYKDIADTVGRPLACRAVGMANNRNPIAIIIPCHRVIGRDGSLTGYAGGLCAKQRLLELEGCRSLATV